MSQNNLNFFLQPYGSLGIPNHSRDFASALSRNLDNLKLIPIFPKPVDHREAKYGMNKEISSRLGRPNRDYPSLMFWYPDVYPTVLGMYPKNIGYYIFEYTVIPPQFVAEINQLDGICTASQWGVDVLKKNGVTVPCYVIPGGVDHGKFNSNGRNIPESGPFRFLHIGKFENRKGTQMLIEAFNEAFEGDPNVRLTLSIDNVHIPEFSAQKFLDNEALVLKFRSDNVDLIHFVDDIVKLYNTHHAAVFPTKAEGIGLPITEAMACGVPVITTWNSGITEYANDENAILMRNTVKVPVQDNKFFPKAGIFGEWDAPTKEELVEKLRWVYNNYKDAKKIGENAEEYMKSNYTWDLAAKIYIQEVL